MKKTFFAEEYVAPAFEVISVSAECGVTVSGGDIEQASADYYGEF